MHIQFRIRILSSSLKRSAVYHIVRQCVVVFSAVVYQVTPFIVPAAIVVLGVIYFFRYHWTKPKAIHFHENPPSGNPSELKEDGYGDGCKQLIGITNSETCHGKGAAAAGCGRP